MPNTPSLVREGASVYSPGEYATIDDCNNVEKIMKGVGTIDKIPEKLISAAIGVCGSSPAYIFMIIEALADGGVEMGLPRELALKLASQAVKGSGSLVLETKEHPGVLKDAVCSPGGTTIEAVHVLENHGIRSAIIDAVVTACKKNINMERNSYFFFT